MTPKLAELLNQCEAPKRIMLFTLPLRYIRVVAMDESLKTFRVEQLVFHNRNVHDPKGAWAALSTHAGPVAGGSYPLAVEAAMKAQQKLREKMAQRAQQTKLAIP